MPAAYAPGQENVKFGRSSQVPVDLLRFTLFPENGKNRRPASRDEHEARPERAENLPQGKNLGEHPGHRRLKTIFKGEIPPAEPLRKRNGIDFFGRALRALPALVDFPGREAFSGKKDNVVKKRKIRKCPHPLPRSLDKRSGGSYEERDVGSKRRSHPEQIPVGKFPEDPVQAHQDRRGV